MARDKMIFIFITLTSCVCAGTFVVNVTQTSYQAEEDQDITLEWTFTEPHRSIHSLSITCKFITDQGSSVLYYLHEGVESPIPWVAGRVQCEKDVLREGRLRLQVSRLRTEDSGRYLCAVSTGGESDSRTCRLNVSAARDRPEPDAPNATSRPQPQSRRGIDVGSGLILMSGAVNVLLALYFVVIRSGPVVNNDARASVHARCRNVPPYAGGVTTTPTVTSAS